MNRTRRFLQHLPLLILMIAPASLFAGTDRSSSQPELRADAQDLHLGFADAKGGNGGGKGGNGGGNGNGNGGNGGGNGNGGNGGNGGGNGNGGNGGNGGKGGGKGGELSAAVQPDTWNTNYEHSEGTVSVVIRGGSLADVDTDSIELTGTDDEAEGLEPVRVQTTRTQIRAFFAKSDAIALLDTPERGETHELTLEFTLGEGEAAETKSLTFDVRIVGPGSGDDDDGDGEDDELEAEIQPSTWNTNWANSAGTVSVKITGDNLGDVDLKSIVLVGTDTAAEPLKALRASKTGNHIRAFFAKKDAIKTLDTPTAGETHDVIIRFKVGDEETELTDVVRITGPGGD